jgi:hypothetical protein
MLTPDLGPPPRHRARLYSLRHPPVSCPALPQHPPPTPAIHTTPALAPSEHLFILALRPKSTQSLSTHSPASPSPQPSRRCMSKSCARHKARQTPFSSLRTRMRRPRRSTPAMPRMSNRHSDIGTIWMRGGRANMGCNTRPSLYRSWRSSHPCSRLYRPRSSTVGMAVLCTRSMLSRKGSSSPKFRL